MIYEALIAPTESPPTLLAIKRALLTYDKVFLVDPADRDMMPGTAWMTAVAPPLPFPIPIGHDVGPVRPMGKVIGYDDQFQRTFEMCRAARDQGLIELRSTYHRPAEGALYIGPDAGTHGFPLHPRQVLGMYRQTAVSQDFLASAVSRQARALAAELDVNPGLACSGFADPQLKLPIIEDESLGPIASAMSQIARARLAAFIKYAGYCEVKDMVPVLPSDAYGGITELALRAAGEALLLLDEDRFWAKRSRVLALCHEEFMLDERLEPLSVDEVIQLRTGAWGKQAEAREQLFEAIYRIANETELDDKFDEYVRPQIAEYRKLSDELVKEREVLQSWIKCELAEGAFKGGLALGGGTLVLGLETLVQSPLSSIGMTLALAGTYIAQRRKEYLPKKKQLEILDTQLRRNRGAGFGLHNFYSRIR